MENKANVLINNSILYRSSQKYFDHHLSEYNLSYGQIIFLILINENQGMSQKDLADYAHFDKATVTSGVKSLEKSQYIKIISDDNDKRVKRLYTTKEAEQVISRVYLIRRDWWNVLSNGLSTNEIDDFENKLQLIINNAIKEDKLDDEVNNHDIHFFGLQKLTLLDYPGKMACTLFTGGCNLRCPFCQNSDLVYLAENTYEIALEDINNFLKKRKGILEGVCISGGEPLLHPGLDVFLKEVKDLGYKVKLDTNGSFPERLKSLIDQKLVDYVAMDIKNCKERYAETIGVMNFDLSPIEKSVKYLMDNHIDYEFRTTIVKEFHNQENIKAIGKWLKGAKALYLQNFEDSERVIQSGLHAHDKETLNNFKDILSADITKVEIRGI